MPMLSSRLFTLFLRHPALGDDLPHYLPIMYGIAYTLERIYARIKSGNFWSDKSDDYFDLLAWHPYVMANVPCIDIKSVFTILDEPDHLWKDFNDAAYRVMCKYGDAHKPVLLTEEGFTDCGDPALEEQQAAYTKKSWISQKSFPMCARYTISGCWRREEC